MIWFAHLLYIAQNWQCINPFQWKIDNRHIFSVLLNQFSTFVEYGDYPSVWAIEPLTRIERWHRGRLLQPASIQLCHCCQSFSLFCCISLRCRIHYILYLLIEWCNHNNSFFYILGGQNVHQITNFRAFDFFLNDKN